MLNIIYLIFTFICNIFTYAYFTTLYDLLINLVNYLSIEPDLMFITTPTTDLINKIELTDYNSPIIDIFLNNLDPFTQELKFYNHGAEYPELWLDEDLYNQIMLNSELMKVLFKDFSNSLILPSYQEANNVFFTHKLPSYQSRFLFIFLEKIISC